MTKTDLNTAERIRQNVREGYADIATATDRRSGCGAGGCCAPGAASVAERLGYDADELETLPEGAEMGLGCGNPTALASLSPGEVVLDLGAGGGVDVFLAAMKVGPTGRAIGVDMTPQMVSKARAGVPKFYERSGLDNVDFRLGEIEHLPIADASVDVVISNCVINLSPDKPQVWREIARVLRPGGRVAVSDIVRLKPIPERVQKTIESWVGCVAGSSAVDEIRAMAGEAGLVQISVEPKRDYLEALDESKDPLYTEIVEHLPDSTNLAEFVASASITAVKPGGCT